MVIETVYETVRVFQTNNNNSSRPTVLVSMIRQCPNYNLACLIFVGQGLVRVKVTVADRVNPPNLIVENRQQNVYEEFR